MPHILYGSPASLFSGKARAYLDWKRVRYSERAPTAAIMQEKIIPAVGYPVIPVIEKDDGQLIQDTTVIIDHFEASEDGPGVYPDTPVQRLAALLLELHGDEWLVIPAMHYRWNYNEEWIYGEFGRSWMPEGTAEEQYAVGKENGQRFKGFVPMLGISETTIPAIEKSYEALLTDLDRHFAVHPYTLGTRPSIGDYGLIGPLYAHLYRDPESGKLMKRIAPNVAAWVERMIDVAEPLSGDFLPDDTIPETLVPVLRRLMGEHMPHLQAIARIYADWAKANPDDDIPRAVGMAPFEIEGVSGEKFASTFSLWMLERPLDFYRRLADGDRAAADALLDTIGGDGFRDFDLPAQVDFVDHRIVRA